ncbi:MAG: hypothetical protein AAGF49_00830 [Pseudomonadota bacterium]
MNAKTSIISATTAFAIAIGSLTAATPGQAAPFAAIGGANIETAAPAVEEVGRRGRRYRRGWRRGHRRHHGGAAAAAIIGLTAGAIIAGAAAGPRCRVVRVRRWSPRYQAYVVRRQRVC